MYTGHHPVETHKIIKSKVLVEVEASPSQLQITTIKLENYEDT
jgi:hypothetical protein